MELVVAGNPIDGRAGTADTAAAAGAAEELEAGKLHRLHDGQGLRHIVFLAHDVDRNRLRPSGRIARSPVATRMVFFVVVLSTSHIVVISSYSMISRLCRKPASRRSGSDQAVLGFQQIKRCRIVQLEQTGLRGHAQGHRQQLGEIEGRHRRGDLPRLQQPSLLLAEVVFAERTAGRQGLGPGAAAARST